MKKRLLSLALCLVMVFTLLPFGASAQIYSITADTQTVDVRFKNGTTLIDTQIAVKQDPDEQLAAGAIHDPGCTLGDNEVFLGWSYKDLDGNTVETKTDGEGNTVYLTVDDVLAYLNEKWSDLRADGLDVTAVTSEVHYIVYYDESGRVMKTQDVVYKTNGNSWNTTVNYDYAPADLNSDFYGWDTSDAATNVVYENDASVTLNDTLVPDGSLELYPVCKTGFWVTFDEHDKFTWNGNDVNIHASYQPPVFAVTGGSVDVSNYEVTADGWTFDGWYDAAEGGNKITAPVTEAKTVYAHWTPKGNIGYKVAHWQQNANDDEYSLVADQIDSRTGTAGDLAEYTAKSFEGFTLNSQKTDEAATTIAGDGSTIRNVYYDRNVYTITFHNGASNIEYKTITGFNLARTGNNYHNYYIQIDGKWYQITGEGQYVWGASAINSVPAPGQGYISYKYGNRTYTDAPVSGTEYNLVDTSIIQELTITAKYGEDVSNLWPDKRTDLSTHYSASWATSPNGDRYQNGISTMPLGNKEFYQASNSGRYEVHFTYLLQDIPSGTGSGATYSVDHENIVYRNNETSTSWDDYEQIEGFRCNVDKSDFQGDGGTWDDTYYIEDHNYTMSAEVGSGFGTRYRNDDRVYGWKYYYIRNSYNLTFISNGASIGSQNVYYEAPLSGYNPSGYVIGETIQTINNTLMIFQGWYDNDVFAGDPFDFDSETMPAKNVTLYAKWGAIQHRVVMNANGGMFGTGEDASTEISFKIDDGANILPNNPAREGYSLVGWYTSDGQKFNLDTKLTLNVMTDQNYPTAPETDDAGVKGKLELFARWRKVMNPDEYLMVKYEPNGFDQNGVAVSGTVAKQDPLHYVDMAEAIAQPAATTTDDGAVFVEWEILDKNGAPTGKTVKPGGTFVVMYDDADDNGEVTLRAKYSRVVTTHIVFVGNGGTRANGETTYVYSDVAMNTAKAIVSADTFTNPNGKFLGWARLNENEMKDGDGWKSADLTAADLWLAYDSDTGKYTDMQTNKTATAIAANELEPFHVLYAVWLPYSPNTYLIDFSAPMKVATDVTKPIEKETHNNGTFTKTNTDVTYQLSMTGTVNSGTATLTTAYSAVDSAVVYGKAAGKDAVAWNKITTIPANSIYFDDDILNTKLTADGQSGYTNPSELPAYNAVRKDTADGKVQLFYTFTGTGIDVYCTTKSDGGYVSAALFKGGIVESTGKPNMDKSNRVGDIVTMKNYSVDERYNVPTIHFVAPECGTYTLMFSIPKNANYYLDGIRVYNAVSDQALYTDNGAEAEANASFFNLRDLLVNGESSYAVTVDASKLNAAEGVNMSNYDQLMSQISNGILFIDGADKIPTVNKKDDGSLGGIYETAFDAYKANGPKNEIYLSQGQSIAFTVMNYQALKNEGAKFQIGLSAPDKNKNTATVSGVSQTTVSSQLDMYYDLVPNKVENGAATFIIKNEGQNLISVTDLKVSGSANKLTLPDGATAKVMAVEDAEPAGETTLNVAVNGLTMRAMLISVNPDLDDTASEPVEEPTEEPTTQQTIRDILRQILSDFVSRLFGSIGHLFGH